MCGIFGVVRCSDPEHASAVVDVVLALGRMSEERGRDASGLAMLIAERGKRDVTKPAASDHAKAGCGIDGAYIVKDTVPFSRLAADRFRGVLEQATVVIGHTRWATQGRAGDRVNASPLLAGALIGTHNGDIDTASLPGHRTLRKNAAGSTDSEQLYLALSDARNDRRTMVSVLKAAHGRAALAFVDRGRPDRLYLARTALSPLCVTHDQHGNLYYASNPEWFRNAQQDIPAVQFSDITLVPEGHLLTIDTITGTVIDTRRFTPTCRESDVRMSSVSAYRGFTEEDRAADQALARHKVVTTPLGPWPAPATVPSKPRKPARPVDLAASSSPQDGWADAELPDIEEIEQLCWIGDAFDHSTFDRLLGESDITECWKIIERLREGQALRAVRSD